MSWVRSPGPDAEAPHAVGMTADREQDATQLLQETATGALEEGTSGMVAASSEPWTSCASSSSSTACSTCGGVANSPRAPNRPQFGARGAGRAAQAVQVRRRLCPLPLHTPVTAPGQAARKKVREGCRGPLPPTAPPGADSGRTTSAAGPIGRPTGCAQCIFIRNMRVLEHVTLRGGGVPGSGADSARRCLLSGLSLGRHVELTLDAALPTYGVLDHSMTISWSEPYA